MWTWGSEAPSPSLSLPISKFGRTDSLNSHSHFNIPRPTNSKSITGWDGSGGRGGHWRVRWRLSWWTEVLPDLCEVVVLRVPRMTVCLHWEKGREIGWPRGHCLAMQHLWNTPGETRPRERTAQGHPGPVGPCVSLQPCDSVLPAMNWIRCCEVLSDQMSYCVNPLNINPSRLHTIARKPPHSLPEPSYSFRSSVIWEKVISNKQRLFSVPHSLSLPPSLFPWRHVFL